MAGYGDALRKKVVSHNSKTIHADFAENILWSSSGSYALNLLLTGNPKKGFCYGKSAIVGGISGSGKSLVLATAAKAAQKDQNAFIMWCDAEKAGEKEWFARTGMDISPDNFFRAEVATISDVAKIWSDVVDTYDAEKKAYDAGKGAHPRPVFFVVDSFTVLLTDTQMGYANSGEVVGDQGQQAKQLKDLIKKITHLSARRNISANGVVHTMQEQSSNPKQKVKAEILLGGRGLEYLVSMAFIFTKSGLTEDAAPSDDDDDDDKGAKKVIGIRATAKLVKSRFSKPNERVKIDIPYDTGITLSSGVFQKFFDEGLIVMPTKGWYKMCEPVEGIPSSNFRKSQFDQYCEAAIAHFYPDTDEVDVVSTFDEAAADAA